MKTPHVIDIELDAPTRMSPAISQVDRLLKQSLLETQSLQVVRHLLLRDQLDKAQLNGHGKLLAAATLRQEHLGEEPLPQKKRRKNRIGRKSGDERKAQVVAYLQDHPGADTLQIAAGLGWRPALVVRFAREVAKSKPTGHRKPSAWTLKTAAPAKPDLRPSAILQSGIREFLTSHPEAFTKDIAKALKRTPNSSFVKIVRKVAKPLRPTKATQPIQWVLT